MKKHLIAAAMLVGALVANAEGYNRAGVSYEHPMVNFNKEANEWNDKSETLGMNGFGLNYVHGFGVATNMFVEVGGNVNFSFGNKSVSYDDAKDETKFQNINLTVPVNYVYRISLTEEVSLDPYAGINFKLNLATKYKNKYTDEDGVVEDDWVNVYNDNDKNMNGKDYTWNRFQMGWQVGVGCNYNQYYVGVQFGTDFIPAYSHNFDGYKPKINTSNLKITLAYTF